MQHLENLLKTFVIVCAISACKLSTSPIVKKHPPPDVDLCSMGMPRASNDPNDIWIDCEPWFYGGRVDYEQTPVKAAKMKYFLIAPNHFRQLQIWIETIERESRR